MASYSVYRLTFKTQLHLGRAAESVQQSRLGLEKTDIYIRADILFSAICQTWATFYDPESLTAFLDPYRQDAPVLPLMLTSAFPFAGDVYFFPKPLIRTDHSKESKQVQFVSYNIFLDILSGNSPAFNTDDLINAEHLWISPEEKTQIATLLGSPSIVYDTDIRPRVTIGSQNAGSEIWHIETLGFNTCCGLWFAAAFDTHETQQKFETLLRVLGDTGIGGERNAGYGMFDAKVDRLEIPMQVGHQSVTLSPICPQSPAELQRLREGNIAYTLKPVSGWISTTGNNVPRKQVHLFAEGSVLHTQKQNVGKLIDLTPETSTHPVYRYGYAWQVGIKGASE